MMFGRVLDRESTNEAHSDSKKHCGIFFTAKKSLLMLVGPPTIRIRGCWLPLPACGQGRNVAPERLGTIWVFSLLPPSPLASRRNRRRAGPTDVWAALDHPAEYPLGRSSQASSSAHGFPIICMPCLSPSTPGALNTPISIRQTAQLATFRLQRHQEGGAQSQARRFLPSASVVLSLHSAGLPPESRALPNSSCSLKEAHRCKEHCLTGPCF